MASQITNICSASCNLIAQETRWYPGCTSISDTLKLFRAAECIFRDLTSSSLTSPSSAYVRPVRNSVVTVMKHRSTPIGIGRNSNTYSTNMLIDESGVDVRTEPIMNSWFRLIEVAYSTSFTNRCSSRCGTCHASTRYLSCLHMHPYLSTYAYHDISVKVTFLVSNLSVYSKYCVRLFTPHHSLPH
jgi:hypothetical protein